MVSNKLTVLCVLFKPSYIPALPYILPVQSGAALSSWQSDHAKDNTGINISLKNATHSELTSLYWAWKNDAFGDSKYVGVCHYRRFFLTSKPLLSRTGFYKFNKINKAFERKIENLPSVAEKLLEKFDIITSKPFSTRISKKEKVSLRKQYAFYHHAEDWELLKKSVGENQPAYANSFEEYEQQGYFYQFNMFIAKKDFFEKYMQWLMSILEPLEKILPVREEVYQSRAIAFLSERLLGLYIYHHRMKTCWLPVGFLE